MAYLPTSTIKNTNSIYDDSHWGKVKVNQISLHLSRMLAFVHRLCSNFSHVPLPLRIVTAKWGHF